MHFIVLMDGVIFESPVSQSRLEWFSDLRGQIPQKIALYLTSISQLVSAWQADVADYYNLLTSKTGKKSTSMF